MLNRIESKTCINFAASLETCFNNGTCRIYIERNSTISSIGIGLLSTDLCYYSNLRSKEDEIGAVYFV